MRIPFSSGTKVERSLSGVCSLILRLQSKFVEPILHWGSCISEVRGGDAQNLHLDKSRSYYSHPIIVRIEQSNAFTLSKTSLEKVISARVKRANKMLLCSH